MFLTIHAGAERIRFFESLRKDLEKKAAEGYEALIADCERVQQLITQKYSDVPLVQEISTLESRMIDCLAQSMMPTDCQHRLPLRCEADGNCLYR